MSQNLDFNSLVPASLKNELQQALVSNLFNRFVSSESSVQVDGTVGQQQAGLPPIVETTLERTENALIPGLFFKSGTTEYLYIFQDFVDKMQMLDVDQINIREWIAEQPYNYTLPIDYDRFVNYTNYYWASPSNVTGFTALPSYVPNYSWNPKLIPEYYVQARPAPTDNTKMPVDLATTRDVNLYINDRPPETFTVLFLSNSTFQVTSNLGTVTPSVTSLSSLSVSATTTVGVSTASSVVAPGLYDNNTEAGFGTDQLISFIITNGSNQFSAGDYFTITVTYFTSSIFTAFNSSSVSGKGSVSGVTSTSPYMYIDGVRLKGGERILVKNQTNPAQNGVYVANVGGAWTRSYDANTAADLPAGTIVYVMGGAQAGTTFITTGPVTTLGTTPITFVVESTNSPSPVNQWQFFNYWIHKDDFATLAPIGVTIENSIQAQRPIIQYSDDIQINGAVDANGYPADKNNLPVGGVLVPQVKTRFNQLPQFDLFRFDGTHQGATSSLFFYVENPDYATDQVLERRVETNVNGDFVFGIGLVDSVGRLLYYADNSSGSPVFKSIWQQSTYGTTPTASTAIYNGLATPGNVLVGVQAYTTTTLPDNQVWTLTALTPTTFSIVGSRSGNIGTLTVGSLFTPTDVDDLTSIMVSAAMTGSYAPGDTFTFNVYAPLAPRYIEQQTDGTVINFPGGPAADTSGVGAWLNPLRMFQNLNRETRQQVAYGDLLDHMASVLQYQNGFTGSPFGDNNFREIPFNPGLGGQIRDFSSNFPLLASMLIQDGTSPLSIITFAQQQYNIALSSVDQFLINNFATYIATTAAVTTTTINPSASDIIALEEYFETMRGEDMNLSTVFSDTTSGVTNWPVTLPQIGLLPPVVPSYSFDMELGINIITCHDGHVTPLSLPDQAFNTALVQSVVPRSDGTYTPGVFSTSMPSSPYARQLWMNTTTFQLYLFNVTFDTNVAPISATTGEYWFQRSTGFLYQWNNGWAIQNPSVIPTLWIPVAPDAVRNSLVLCIENKLYAAVNPVQQLNITLLQNSIINSPYAELELASFALEYNYDTYAPNYNPTNAFTWNYKQATIPPLSPTPARWFNIYEEYFATFAGVVPTPRPDLQPWCLLGYATEPAFWASSYASTVSATTVGANVAAVATTNIAALSGLITIDGYTTSVGDRILLTAQTSPQFNGVYIASSGGWARAADTLVSGLGYFVTNGYAWGSTTWAITTTGPITVGTTPVNFGQVRTWLPSMWSAIQTSQPTMKLCVNVNTDSIIPPYVSPTQFSSSQALLTAIPPGVADGYVFGDDGPVEQVWKKSLEYGYGLARSYFRLYPLQFLDSAWGETYIQTGPNVRVERNTMAPLPASKFLLHGEALEVVNNYDSAAAGERVAIQLGGSITWGQQAAAEVTFKVVYCELYNTTVLFAYVNGVQVNNSLTNSPVFFEGVPFNLTYGSGSTLIKFTNVQIEDRGIPFEYGDVITVTFYNDNLVETTSTLNTIISTVVGCEGCFAQGTTTTTQVISDSQVLPTYSFTPGLVKILPGVGQWFTDLLRYSYIDTDVSQAALAFRGWDLYLVHRMGAMIRPDSLSITTSQGTLDTAAYNMMIKRSTAIQDPWISALRVQLVQMGTTVLAPSGELIPAGAADDWIFRITTYHPNDVSVPYFPVDTSGPYTDFKALNGAHTSLAWNHYTTDTSRQYALMPLTITGLQNVINFIYGYVDYLTSLGWKLNVNDVPVTDQQTGRNLDWQLEIEKMIDLVYSGMSAGSAYSLNPFATALYIQTPVGLLSRFTDNKFTDVFSTQAAYDVLGTVIPIKQMMIVRTDDQTVVYSNTPIYSAHVFIDQFEHVIIMNQKTSTASNALTLFDPFLGLRIQTAYLKFVAQDGYTGKPTFDGFFISGNDLVRNMSSSVDQMGNYYDATKTFNDPTTVPHALALLGWQDKSYFDSLNVSQATQFNFWRGMIHAKGTTTAINAFLNFKDFAQGSVDEYWAYKVAEYGDAREKSFPEIVVNPPDTFQKFTSLQFYTNGDLNYQPLPLFIQIEADDDSRWYSFDDLGKGMWFEANPISETIVVPSGGTFPQYYPLKNIYDNTGSGAELPQVTGPGSPVMINANLLKVTVAGTYTVSGYSWLNRTKLSPIKLFNYVTEQLVDQHSLWHPAIGIHAWEPLEVVDLIMNTDPARYNYTPQTINNPNYQLLKPWGKEEVGTVWWNTENLGYVPYYDTSIFPNRSTRHSRWGNLAAWASVDLYEWTESDYPPSQYNAQAALQQGNASIDPTVALSGTIAQTVYYASDRQITINPIAWSYNPSGVALSQPSFINASFTKVYVSGSTLIADTGTTAAINLTSGYNFGGWDAVNLVPVGEAQIGTTVSWVIGSSTDPSAPAFHPTVEASGTISSMSLAGTGSNFGSSIGQIQLVANVAGSSYALRMMDSSGNYQDVTVADWNVSTLGPNATQTFVFNKFGLSLTVVRSTIGLFTAADLVAALTTNPSDIFIREAVSFTSTVTPVGGWHASYSNDPLDTSSEYQWITWQIPTQTQLSADILPPNNAWQPYIGAAVVVPATPATIAGMQATPLTLSSGITVNRYTSTWLPWVALTDYRATQISTGLAAVSFTVPSSELISNAIDTTRLSVYSNGIQIIPTGYVVSGATVTLVNTLPEGTTVLLLYRAYQPTPTDLAFNPAVSDNVQLQTQYKLDWQYSMVEQRDVNGNITGIKYYFWVQNKTIAGANQSMSLLDAAAMLASGPDTYTIFSRLRTVPQTTMPSYDSCAIAGLSNLVSNTNTFKLRFLRDFTLTNAPGPMTPTAPQALKNTHTEWTLIRKQQTSKIPYALWEALTDAACGQTAGGISVPSQERINYDAKHGTLTQFGFEPGQIFAPTDLVQGSISYTIQNTQVVLDLGATAITDYITVLQPFQPSTWFATPAAARNTMNLIWSTARPQQINEIFFNVLDDALANNYQITDLFKTSMITVNSTTNVVQAAQSNLRSEFY
jgi:hypothetical protein